MLNAVDQNYVVVLEDLVDDAVVASPSRPESFEFSEKRLAEPLRILGDRPQDRLECSGPHLLGQAMEMPESLGGDLDLVQRTVSDRVSQAQPLSLSRLGTRPAKRLHELVVAKDVEALLE